MTTSEVNGHSGGGDHSGGDGHSGDGDHSGRKPGVPRFLLLAVVIVVALLPLVLMKREAEAPILIVLDGPTMGTTYSVKFASLPDGVTTAGLQEELRAILERINRLMSTYDPDSEVSRFNRHEGLDWFDMSAETISVVSVARRVSDVTGGAFDITVGPLVDLWGFGGKSESDGSAIQQEPSTDEIRTVRGRLGFRHLEIREDPPALRRARVGIGIDLSGIAKGHAVDQIADHVESAGVDSYMVEVGGEIRTRGLKPDGRAWRLGIEAPLRGERSVHREIELRNDAMATSGDYRNYFESKGNVYSHLLDPRTGRPVKHRLASVSVIADKCINADALATALMVLGPAEGYRVALEHELAVLWVLRSKGNDGAPSGVEGDAGGIAGPVGTHRFIDKTSPAFEERESTEGSPE